MPSGRENGWKLVEIQVWPADNGSRDLIICPILAF
jgi:hypothetical protein